MSGEGSGAMRCPRCGAPATTAFCGNCGASLTGTDDPTRRVSEPTPFVEDSTRQVDVPRLTDAPTAPIPLAGNPAAQAVPGMFATEFVPPVGPQQAWSQQPELGPPSGIFPGWTGLLTTVADPQAQRRQRRKRALLAVGGVALATAIILLIALVVAPSWRGTPNIADPTPQQSPSSAPSVTTSGSATSEPVTQSNPQPPVSSVQRPTRTITVTATAPVSTPPSTPPVSTPPTTPKTTPPKTTPAPLGVPQKEIACGSGYIVQLASEVNAATFKQRVAVLTAAKQVPAGAHAADSTKSCKIFSGQVNTLVLYAGPFAGPYDGCAARLAGPPDAFIRGQNPETAHRFVSCLCPAVAAGLPEIKRSGEHSQWIGELQRVLGNRLNYDIDDLGGNWGTYTKDTREAVEDFQKDAKLKADGQVGPATWRALQAAACR